MCDILSIQRSTYYQSLYQTTSNREQENNRLIEKIIEIYKDSNKRYEAPKIHRCLLKQEYQISIKRVRRLMKQAGITVREYIARSTYKIPQEAEKQLIK